MLSIRTRTSLAQIGGVLNQAFGGIFGYLAEMGTHPAGPPFAVYHDPEFKEDDLDVEMCVPVAGSVAGRGRVAAGMIAAGPVAYTLHTGPYQRSVPPTGPWRSGSRSTAVRPPGRSVKCTWSDRHRPGTRASTARNSTGRPDRVSPEIDPPESVQRRRGLSPPSDWRRCRWKAVVEQWQRARRRSPRCRRSGLSG